MCLYVQLWKIFNSELDFYNVDGIYLEVKIFEA